MFYAPNAWENDFKNKKFFYSSNRNTTNSLLKGQLAKIAERTTTKRCSETFQAVTRIHGASPSNVMTTPDVLIYLGIAY